MGSSSVYYITFRLQIGNDDFSDMPREEVFGQVFRKFPNDEVIFLSSHRLCFVDQQKLEKKVDEYQIFRTLYKLISWLKPKN